ncbi:hypothetical protein BDP81DRAFT_444976 [Colletotrichum phormii]|uniref:Xylanolytic transcriptional activator regulatory domain-containing protein n=1 Tax=Colletotrichum phormii TaxID=359342 RepID=A0AAJ0A4S0_9PEZI|nr:uncharacterized protein BDP81DRAFT_444976 [Colletotrichum phormii]KAK1656472.1 hypothetical protein BDP81DRAFT_444976 [Colletotrichum phormii]
MYGAQNQLISASLSTSSSTLGINLRESSDHDQNTEPNPNSTGWSVSPIATSPNTDIQNVDFVPDFPASLFLDIDWYTWSRARPPVRPGTIPELPMISKKRIDMGLSLQNAGPDLAMLFLSTRLVTTPVTHGFDLNPYREAKKSLARLEENGTISLILLQAMILIALYEYGHAIYPAAWMTVGSCARYSDIVGLAPGDFSALRQDTTWTEAEERRRVWWSVFILDKIVALGSRRRCVVTEPQVENRLPVDDDSWDCGEVGKAFGHSTSTPYQTQQSGFARLCQVPIYISRVIGFARSGSSAPCIPEITSLVNDLNGFALAVDRENTDWRLEASSSFLSSRALARSALFIALDRFTCPEKISVEPGYVGEQGTKSQEELDFDGEQRLPLEVASRQLHFMATNILPHIPTAEGDETQLHASSLVSPFIMDGIYAGAATLHLLVSLSQGS